MPLQRLEHYLVLSDNIHKTRDFYSAWTQKVGLPISTRAASTGAVDHIAFNGTGFAEVRDRLAARGLKFSENSIEDIGLRQVFLRDPNGVPLEINFRS